MREKYRELYNGIHADEELKRNTINMMLDSEKKQNKSAFVRPAFKIVTACLAAVILLGTGAGVYTVNAEESYVTVESTAQVGLSVNRWNKVISVNCMNEEAETMAEKIHFKGMTYDEALDAILEYQGIIDEVADISVSVKCNNESKGKEMQDQVDRTVEECKKQMENCKDGVNKSQQESEHEKQEKTYQHQHNNGGN